MRIVEKGQRAEASGRTFVSRIVISIALTILFTCSSIAALTTYQSFSMIRDSHFDQARRSIVIAFKSAVDSETYPTLPQLVEHGEHLLKVTDLTGGAYYDAVGEYRARFGAKPLLTWQKAKLSGIDHAFVDDGKQMEIYVDPHTLEIDYGVALRFKVDDVWTAIDAEIARKITSVIAVTLAATISLTLLITVIVLVPINRMRTALRYALDDPKDAVSNALHMRRRDEVGQLSRNIDQLLYVVSHTFEEDLGNALAIQAHIPNPLIIYNSEGEIDEANPAALEFFGVHNPLEIEGHEREYIRIDDKTMTAREFVEAGQVLEYGEVRLGEAWVPCRIGGDIIRRQNGAVRRYFVIITDLSIAQTQLDEITAERDKAIQDAYQWHARNRELRHLLDACMTVIEGGKVTSVGRRRVTALPERVINVWYRDAVQNGLMEPRSLRHSILPPLRMEIDDAQRIFSNALFALHARSASALPKILITSRDRADAMVELIITEMNLDGKTEAIMAKQGKVGASLYLAAFTNLVNSAGGTIVRITGANGENTIVFRLLGTAIKKTPIDIDPTAEDSEAA